MTPEGVHFRCNACKKPPEEISEYVDIAEELNTTPARFVQTEEGMPLGVAP